MALVSNITKVITVPGENISVTIRKLNHKILKEAEAIRRKEGVGFMREMGGELLKAIRESDKETVKKIQEATEDDITNYDRDVLLKRGIVLWDYPIEAGKLPEATDDLDEPTAKFIAQAIFDFSRRETTAEAKND
jgi:hypothetical protein